MGIRREDREKLPSHSFCVSEFRTTCNTQNSSILTPLNELTDDKINYVFRHLFKD